MGAVTSTWKSPCPCGPNGCTGLAGREKKSAPHILLTTYLLVALGQAQAGELDGSSCSQHHVMSCQQNPGSPHRHQNHPTLGTAPYSPALHTPTLLGFFLFLSLPSLSEPPSLHTHCPLHQECCSPIPGLTHAHPSGPSPKRYSLITLLFSHTSPAPSLTELTSLHNHLPHLCCLFICLLICHLSPTTM